MFATKYTKKDNNKLDNRSYDRAMFFHVIGIVYGLRVDARGCKLCEIHLVHHLYGTKIHVFCQTIVVYLPSYGTFLHYYKKKPDVRGTSDIRQKANMQIIFQCAVREFYRPATFDAKPILFYRARFFCAVTFDP